METSTCLFSMKIPLSMKHGLLFCRIAYLITGPPTHSVGGPPVQTSNGRWRLSSSVVICRCRLSSSVTHHGGPAGGFTGAGQAMTSCRLQSNYSSTVTLHGGPVVLRAVRATHRYKQFIGFSLIRCCCVVRAWCRHDCAMIPSPLTSSCATCRVPMTASLRSGLIGRAVRAPVLWAALPDIEPDIATSSRTPAKVF